MLKLIHAGAARRLAALVGRELRGLRVRRARRSEPSPSMSPHRTQRKAEEDHDVRELEEHFPLPAADLSKAP